MGCREKSMVKALMLAIAMLAPAGKVLAHPLHTSLTQISFDASRRNVSVSIRAFTDDLSMAAQASGLSPADYAARAFRLTNSRGVAIRLSPCGEKRVGDLVWLCFKGSVGSHPDDLRVSSTMLFEKYKDQINVVTVIGAKGARNFLFTPGDSPKQLTASR
jgi:hypothetical protein